MLPPDQIPNLIGWLIGLVPMAGFCYFLCINRGENWRLSKLLCGIGLILVGAQLANVFIGLLAHLDSMKVAGEEVELVRKMAHSSAVWLSVLPVVSVGLGINIISSWLSSSK